MTRSAIIFFAAACICCATPVLADEVGVGVGPGGVVVHADRDRDRDKTVVINKDRDHDADRDKTVIINKDRDRDRDRDRDKTLTRFSDAWPIRASEIACEGTSKEHKGYRRPRSTHESIEPGL
jgi:hypothetical protein